MEPIQIEVLINAPVEIVWNCFTQAEHIMQWNHAGDDWHCPKAELDLSVGGKFNYQMAAKDGSFSFDFWGYFKEILEHEKLAFSLGEDLGENRWVQVLFRQQNQQTKVTEFFVPENENNAELQKQGWQMILNNFKLHCENL